MIEEVTRKLVCSDCETYGLKKHGLTRSDYTSPYYKVHHSSNCISTVNHIRYLFAHKFRGGLTIHLMSPLLNISFM